jgi:hypothetical protein
MNYQLPGRKKLPLVMMLMSSLKVGYHHRLMFRYQQPEMRVEILQRDAQKQSLYD